MQHVWLKAVLAAVWVLAVLIVGIVGSLNSLSSWILLAGIALLAPIAMMWWLNGPGQTLSESIREARR